MEHHYGALYKNVRLRPLEKRDIEKLRIWRNDAAKTRFLRRIGEITPQMQEQWYADYLSNKDELTFAVEETETLHRMVGSVALYHFRGETAEVGRIQIGDDDASGHGIGRISMMMALWIGFRELGLKKVTASVHRENKAAHISYMRLGFRITGAHEAPVGGIEDEIEIDEKRLREMNVDAAEIILEQQ